MANLTRAVASTPSKTMPPALALEDDAGRWQLSLSTARPYQQFIVRE
jgi:hypothetical protein